MNKLILPIFSAILLGACADSSPTNTHLEPTAKDTIIEQVNETLTTEDSVVIPAEPLEIVELTDINDNMALANYLAYMKEVMENVTNPVQVKYVGCDFGDYFHLPLQVQMICIWTLEMVTTILVLINYMIP